MVAGVVVVALSLTITFATTITSVLDIIIISIIITVTIIITLTITIIIIVIISLKDGKGIGTESGTRNHTAKRDTTPPSNGKPRHKHHKQNSKRHEMTINGKQDTKPQVTESDTRSHTTALASRMFFLYLHLA